MNDKELKVLAKALGCLIEKFKGDSIKTQTQISIPFQLRELKRGQRKCNN